MCVPLRSDEWGSGPPPTHTHTHTTRYTIHSINQSINKRGPMLCILHALQACSHWGTSGSRKRFWVQILYSQSTDLRDYLGWVAWPSLRCFLFLFVCLFVFLWENRPYFSKEDAHMGQHSTQQRWRWRIRRKRFVRQFLSRLIYSPEHGITITITRNDDDDDVCSFLALRKSSWKLEAKDGEGGGVHYIHLYLWSCTGTCCEWSCGWW